MLVESEIEKRRRYIEGLKGRKSKETISILIDSLKDESWRIRKTGLDILLEDYQIEEYIDLLIGLLYLDDNAGARNTAIEGLTRLGKKATPYLIRAFNTDNRDVRKFIIDILGELNDPLAIPLMLRALKDEDENVKVTAVEHLGRIKERSVVDALIEILKGDDVWTAYPAADALGRISDKRAIPYLIDALSKKTLRVPVLKALGKFAEPSTLENVVEMLRDSQRSVQEEAIKCLVKFYHKGMNPDVIVNKLRNILGDNLLEFFLKFTKSPKKETKASSIILLGLLSDPRAIRELLTISEEEEFSQDAKNALVFIARTRPEGILEFFRTEDSYVRRIIVQVAGEVRNEIYYPHLLKLLDDVDGHVRANAARALAMIGNPRAVPPIEGLFLDPYDDVQEAAIDALFELRKGLDVKRLLENLKSPHRILRKNSVRLLGRILPFYPELLMEITHAIGFASKDEDVSVRYSAAQGLKEIVLNPGFPSSIRKEAMRYLRFAITDEDRDVRISSIKAIGYAITDSSEEKTENREILRMLLRDRDDTVKVAVLKIIGETHDKEFIPELINLLESSNGFVVSTAIESLSMIGGDKALSAILRMINHSDREIMRTAIESLRGFLDKNIEEYVIPFLFHEDWAIRMAAVNVLSLSKRPSVRKELEKLLDSEEDPVIKKYLVEYFHAQGI